MLEEKGSTTLKSGLSLLELLRRPEVRYADLVKFYPPEEKLEEAVEEQVEIQVKYEGYINKQMAQIEHFEKLEKKKLRPDLDYEGIKGLSRKLNKSYLNLNLNLSDKLLEFLEFLRQILTYC